MSSRRRVVQNDIVANRMRSFFRQVDRTNLGPENVAIRYGKNEWKPRRALLVDQEERARSRYNVALAIGDDAGSLEWITKRATLVSDTLMLTHDESSGFHPIGRSRDETKSVETAARNVSREPVADFVDQDWFGMHCPDLAALGQWILDSRRMLTAGSVWYLPRYASGRQRGEQPANAGWKIPEAGDRKNHGHVTTVEYLIKDRRAVDASGAEPVKSELVRPVLSIDLPFLDGVDLPTFSEMTVQEFASYAVFRDFLRQALLEMDESVNAVQSERELVKLSLQIRDHVRGVGSEMRKILTKRAVSATGAVVGTVSAVLVAVHGPAMQAAIAALGASGGLWGILHAMTENNARGLREGRWFYVWALAEGTSR